MSSPENSSHLPRCVRSAQGLLDTNPGDTTTIIVLGDISIRTTYYLRQEVPMTLASLRSKPFFVLLICLSLLLIVAVFSVALLPSQARAAGHPRVTSDVTKTVMITTTKKGVFTFRPKMLKIAAGTTVVWKNMTQAPHTVSSDTGIFDSGVISPGGTFTFKFTQAGTFAYHCNIHPFMTASVTVS